MSIYWKMVRAIFTIKRKIRFAFKSQKRKESKTVGMPVYFEDTGELVGRVKRIVWNSLGEIIGYEIEDDSRRTFYFPADAFEKTKRGLIFAPLWYSEGLKMIAELEAKTKMPDVHDFILQNMDREELYNKITETYPSIRKYVEEVLMLREALISRLNDLEVKMIELRKKLVDLSGKRLLKQISRKEFAEKIIEARREMNIIEISRNRCKELLMRIDSIPFLPKKIGEGEILSIKKVIENIPVNIVILDEYGKIKSGNNFITKNFGYSIEEIKGRHFSEFVIERDRQKIGKETLANGKPKEFDFEFVDKYGIHHKLYGRVIKMESMNIMVFYEAKEHEALEKIFSEKIAHLFFNPLSIAQGYVYLLSEEKYGRLTEEQRKQIEGVKKSLERIEKLLKETIKLTP